MTEAEMELLYDKVEALVANTEVLLSKSVDCDDTAKYAGEYTFSIMVEGSFNNYEE